MEKVDASDDLVDEKDVKTEVMRSRGAGGQVSDTGSAEIPLKVDSRLLAARQQNRVGSTVDPYSHGNNCLDARL